MSVALECCDPAVRLIQLACDKPDLPLYNFIDSRMRITARLTAADTLRKARGVAALIRLQTEIGEPVMLLFPHSADFIVAFLAAKLAGCVPVPVSYHRRLGMIDTGPLIAGTGLRTVVGPAPELARYRAGLKHQGADQIVEAMRYVDINAAVEHDCKADETGGPDIAFIYPGAITEQDSRPLALSNVNVHVSLQALTQQLTPTANDRLLACLDLADGAALLMHLLLPLQIGAPSFFVSLDNFLDSPGLWLNVASAWRCTIINAPASGLALCAHGVAENAQSGLDLGCVRWLCLGGEQLAPCLVEQFMERYGRSGLSRGALFACFGMSAVASYISGRNGFHTRTTDGVSCLNQGRLLPDVQWRLDTDSSVQAIGNSSYNDQHEYVQGGELVLHSPATGMVCAYATAGQGRSPADYISSLVLAHRAGVRMMINTGEQAAIIDGELFCHGRTTHRFSVAEKTYQAEDVEAAVMQAFGSRGLSRCVVLVIDGAREIVLLVECARRQLAENWQGVVSEIILSVNETTGLAVHRVVLLRPGSLHIGVDGTVLRRRCLEAMQDGSLMLRLLPVRGK